MISDLRGLTQLPYNSERYFYVLNFLRNQQPKSATRSHTYNSLVIIINKDFTK